MAEGALVEQTDVASLRMLLTHGTGEHRGRGRRQRDRRQGRHLLTRGRKLHQIGLHRLSEDLVVEIDDGFPFAVVGQHFLVDVLRRSRKVLLVRLHERLELDISIADAAHGVNRTHDHLIHVSILH